MLDTNASPCDLYQDGSDQACSGPRFTDAQWDETTFVCAFHLIHNRDQWMERTANAEAENGLLYAVVEAARAALELVPHDTIGDANGDTRYCSNHALAAALDTLPKKDKERI